MRTTFARWAVRVTFLAVGASGLLLDQADTMNSGSAGWAAFIALATLTSFEWLGWLSDGPTFAIRPQPRAPRAPKAPILRTLSSNPRTRPRLRRPEPRNARPED